MNLTSRVEKSSPTTLQKCPSCEMPATASSSYCGYCGRDLSPQSEYCWHEDDHGFLPWRALGLEAG